MSSQRFDVRFDADALTEYQRLDNALVTIVDKVLPRLEERADEVETTLQNKYATKLHGYKEVKLGDAGLRIVFRVPEQTVEVLHVVNILTIERRNLAVVLNVETSDCATLRVEATCESFSLVALGGKHGVGLPRYHARKTPVNNVAKARGDRTLEIHRRTNATML